MKGMFENRFVKFNVFKYAEPKIEFEKSISWVMLQVELQIIYYDSPYTPPPPKYSIFSQSWLHLQLRPSSLFQWRYIWMAVVNKSFAS